MFLTLLVKFILTFSSLYMSKKNIIDLNQIKNIAKPSFGAIGKLIEEEGDYVIVHSHLHFNATWRAIHSLRNQKPVMWSLRIGENSWVICRYRDKEENPLRKDFEEFIGKKGYGRHKARAEILNNDKVYIIPQDPNIEPLKEAQALAMSFRKLYPKVLNKHFVKIDKVDNSQYKVSIKLRKRKNGDTAQRRGRKVKNKNTK